MANNPDRWTEICGAFDSVGSYAVVAGGCIRDFFLDKEPKDIDVFVEHWGDRAIPQRDREAIAALELTRLPDEEQVPQQADYENQSISHIQDYVDATGQRVQIMWCNNPVGRVESFDFNGVKAYHTTHRSFGAGQRGAATIHGSTHLSDDFLRDIWNKTYTFTGHAGQVERSAVRAARFIENNPDFTVVGFDNVRPAPPPPPPANNRLVLHPPLLNPRPVPVVGGNGGGAFWQAFENIEVVADQLQPGQMIDIEVRA